MRHISRRYKKTAEREQEAVDQTLTRYDEIKKSTSSYKELYDSYKESGVATDELKNSSEALADALGTSSAKAAAAAGDYDALANAADKAAKSQREAAKATLLKQLNGSIESSLSGSELFNGSIYDDANAALYKADYLNYKNVGFGGTESYGEVVSRLTSIENEYNERIAELNEAAKRAGERGDITSQETLKKSAQEANRGLTEIQGVLNQDDITK